MSEEKAVPKKTNVDELLESSIVNAEFFQTTLNLEKKEILIISLLKELNPIEMRNLIYRIREFNEHKIMDTTETLEKTIEYLQGAIQELNN